MLDSLVFFMIGGVCGALFFGSYIPIQCTEQNYYTYFIVSKESSCICSPSFKLSESLGMLSKHRTLILECYKASYLSFLNFEVRSLLLMWN